MRPDRQPLLRRDGQALRVMEMELFIGSTDIDEPVTDSLRTLERLAKSRRPLIVEYDPHTKGLWHMTALSIESDKRSAGKNNVITRAIASVTFTEVADKTEFTINNKTKVVGTERPKVYTTKKKDTLASIVKKFYGTTSPAIVKAVAKANGIKNPKNIKPGTKLKLP